MCNPFTMCRTRKLIDSVDVLKTKSMLKQDAHIIDETLYMTRDIDDVLESRVLTKIKNILSHTTAWRINQDCRARTFGARFDKIDGGMVFEVRESFFESPYGNG